MDWKRAPLDKSFPGRLERERKKGTEKGGISSWRIFRLKSYIHKNIEVGVWENEVEGKRDWIEC